MAYSLTCPNGVDLGQNMTATTNRAENVISNLVRGVVTPKVVIDQTVEHARVLDLESLEEHVGNLWTAITANAGKHVRSHHLLVDFLKRLTERDEIREHKILYLYEARLWKDLPMWGWEINSLWNRE